MYTKGEWRKNYWTVGRIEIVTDNAVICEVHTMHDREEQVSNANLISAAPDLLEALKGIPEIIQTSIECCENEVGFEADPSLARNHWEQIIHSLRIKKAKVQQAINKAERWCKEKAELDSHDGDVDYISMFAGVYDKFMPSKEGKSWSQNKL